jgi:GGDEF domain-containing protein/2'-5' RNA ligase
MPGANFETPQAAADYEDTPAEDAAQRAAPQAGAAAATAAPSATQFMAVPSPKGLVAPGNLPIWNRPVVQNPDGTRSTEYSTSFQDDQGHEVLVPTVVNGRFLTTDGKKPPEGSPEEKAMFKAAWQHYLKTGENLGKFDSPASADLYAGALHNRGSAPAAISVAEMAAHGSPAAAPAEPGLGGVLSAISPAAALARPTAPVDPAQQQQQDALRTEGQREGWMPHKPGGSAPQGNPVYRPGENAPNVAEVPLGPAALKAGNTVFRALWPMGTEDWDRRIADGQAKAADFDARHPNLAASRKGLTDTLSGLTTPANLGLLAVLPESKAIQAFFAAQAAAGAYQNADHAYQSWREGKNPEATQYLTESGLDAIFAAAAGSSALRGHGGEPVPTAVDKQGIAPAQVEQYRSGQAAGRSREAQEFAANPSRFEPKTVEPGAPPPAIGAKEPETGRPVLQQSPRPEVNQAAATAEHPAVKDTLAEVVKPIDGAEVAGAREAKEPERVGEKIESEGQSPRTVRDYSGFRIAVDSTAARDQVVAALRAKFEVPDMQDEFDKGNEETGFHGTTVQVREPGSPVTHEVQILPREVAENADAHHDIYEKARDGDKDAAAQLKAVNEQDWQAFQTRNQLAGADTAGEGGRGQSPEPSAGAEPKYKFGSTQANIPDDSGAAKAIDQMRSKIPDADLAGDGKDIGSGGNHVTVRYGIQGEDTARVEQFLRSQKPFTARLGETEVFPPTKNSNGAAVVTAKIESPELTRLNDEIQQHADFAPSDFPDYKPHATIAYVDPAKADAYSGLKDLAGEEFPIDHVAISDRNGNQREIPLEGAAEAAARPAPERRTDTAARQRVAEMSPEAMRQALLTSEKTGLPNRRAFEEAQRGAPAAAVAMSDADGLKAFNDRFGYAAGDQLLQAKAEALKDAGVEAYHDKGDEFLYRGGDQATLQAQLEKARATLRNRGIEVTLADGTTKVFKGADFSYGTGTDLAAAEAAQKEHKSTRTAAGERERGELRGFTETRPEKGEANTSAAGGGAGTQPAAAEPAGNLPSRPRVAWKAGRQSTPIEVKGADGGWHAGTLDHYNPGFNGGLARGRVTLDDGTKMLSVPPDAMRVPSDDTAASKSGGPWIGVDLDRTLAHYTGYKGPTDIGEPIPAMVDRVKQWLGEGKDVRIFTARVSDDPTGTARAAIDKWTEKNLGEKLPVTNVKDDKMTALYDDRAVHVQGNAGTIDTHAEAQALSPTGAATDHWTGLAEPERVEKFNASRDAAKARSERENAAQAQPAMITTPHGKMLALDPDSAVLWHRVFAKVKDADGRNVLGADVNWRGMSLGPRLVNMATYFLRDRAAKLAAEDPAASAGYMRMAKALEDAKNDQGGLSVLRGDYRDDTIREEAMHAWDRRHRLSDSEAMRTMAQDPLFQETADRLRGMQYGLKPGIEGETELAAEMIGKALAGDKDLELTPQQREDIVGRFLDAAVKQDGVGILADLPETDATIKPIIDDLRRGIPYGPEHESGVPAGDQTAPGGRVRPGNVEPGLENGPGVQGRPSGEPGERGQPQAAGAQPGGEEARRPRGELAPQFQRGKAAPVRPEDSLALPGMEGTDEERAAKLAEAQGQRLTEAMRAPLGDISRKAGAIERDSPLFHGTGDNPTLFQTANGGWAPFEQQQRLPFEEGKEDPRDHIATLDALTESLQKRVAEKPEQSALTKVAEWSQREAEQGIDRAGKFWSGVPGAFRQALSWAKATAAALSHDWTSSGIEQSGWKNGQKQLTLAANESAQKIMAMARPLNELIPDEKTGTAAAIWAQADGDEATLRQWAEKAKVSGKHDASEYEAALNLPEEVKGAARDIRADLDEMGRTGQRAGLINQMRRNYVRHMLDTSSAIKAERLIDASEINPNPSFAQPRFYKDFFEAEQNGEKFQTKDIRKVVAAYHDSFNKAMASRGWLRSMLMNTESDGRPTFVLKSKGPWVEVPDDQLPQIVNQGEKRPDSLEGYEIVDRPQLRNFLFKPTEEDLLPYIDDPKLFRTGKENYAIKGDLMVHPDRVKAVKNMLTPDWFHRGGAGTFGELLEKRDIGGVLQKVGRGVQKASSLVKEINTFGAPFHVVTEAENAAEAWTNPFTIKPIDLSNEVDRMGAQNMALYHFDREGLFGAKTLHGLLHGFPGLSNVADLVNRQADWMFEHYIPSLKMDTFRRWFAGNVKKYPELTRDQVAEVTGKAVDARYGNINHALDQMPRNKTAQAVSRLAFFAPDFLEARARTVLGAFGKYGGQQRQALARGLLMLYVAPRIVNAALNNGDAKWDWHDMFSVVIPKPRTSALAAQQYWRLSIKSPFTEMLQLVTNPREFIAARENPFTTRPAIKLLLGRDDFGRPMNAKDELKDFFTGTSPFLTQKMMQSPDESIQDSLLSAFGAHLSNYRSPTEQKVHELYLSHLPANDDDPEKQAESRQNRQLEDAIREGTKSPADAWRLVDEGKMTPQVAARTAERAQKSRLEIEFAALPLNKAMDIYQHASVAEQAQLHEELDRKHRAIDALPEADREAAEARLDSLLAQGPE